MGMSVTVVDAHAALGGIKNSSCGEPNTRFAWARAAFSSALRGACSKPMTLIAGECSAISRVASCTAMSTVADPCSWTPRDRNSSAIDCELAAQMSPSASGTAAPLDPNMENPRKISYPRHRPNDGITQLEEY